MRIALLAGLLALTMTAQAAELRVALLVGANRGAPHRRPLQFAVEDVRRMEQALLAVGGFEPDAIRRLDEPSADELRQAMASVDSLLERAEADGRSALLLFYYSGHADGVALELGEDRMPFGDIRSWLEKSGARIRVAVVDSCHSGGVAEVKGGRPGAEFDVSLAANVDSEGTVILTSSTSGEKALESEEVRGAFFTHHFVSALYGAADADQDGAVTLEEAWRYTYRRTLASSATTTSGIQHPTFSYRLEGRGELVLARRGDASGIVEFPDGMEGRFFLLDGKGEAMLAEVSKERGAPSRLAVPAGTYRLLQRLADGLRAATVAVGKGEVHVVSEDRFVRVAEGSGWSRGWLFHPSRTVGLFYSLSGWMMPEMGAIHGVGLGLSMRTGPLTTLVDCSWGPADVNDGGLVYSMDTLSANVAPMFRLELSRLDLLGGVVAGTRVLLQDTGPGGRYATATFLAGAIAGIDLVLIDRLSVLMTWELDADTMKLNDVWTVRLSPRAKLGVGVRF
ncbi:MAG: caspase family protein [Deltaproteobacteria bacterium]|nr:caspase family protein [Deltaproteobacteria bacterium]